MLAQFLRVMKIGGILSSDLIVLGTIFVLFFLYAIYFGRDRVVAFIFAFYPAVFLYQTLPFFDKLIVLHGDRLILLNKLGLFLLLFIPLNIIIARYIFSESYGGGGKHYLRIAGCALASVVLFLVFYYKILNLETLYNFSPAVDILFSGPNRLFWWTLAPLAILLFL